MGGRRVYLLASYGSAAGAAQIPRLMRERGMHPLDKLLNEYVLWWPGVVRPNATAAFTNFLDEDATNPTHTLRQKARALNKDILAGKLPPASLDTLVFVNQMLDPDWYGLYRGYVSPENNNFATDFLRPAVLTAVGLVAGSPSVDRLAPDGHAVADTLRHPCARSFIALAQQSLQMDLSHSITLPSGATQEAPGYLGHAMEAWVDDAPIYRKYFGVDPALDPRLLAAVDFQFQLAHPFNYHMLGAAAANPGSWTGRYITPIGDTHPNSVNYTALQAQTGLVPVHPSRLTSVERQGHGAVLRSQPGTASETFLSFKAGPNQGHDHGDQLSIHWCAYGARHAIDLMFGYNPRPLQEYWHNRVSFGVNGTLQNMDGYARLIAVKFSPNVDAAMGMVASGRLRTPPLQPPGIWGANYPWVPLGGMLNYTRTALLVKHGPARDYVVLWDSSTSPHATDVTFNQWYIQDGASCAALLSNTGSVATVDLGNSTLFIVSLNSGIPLRDFVTLRWTNHSEGNEHATGVRIRVVNVTRSDLVAVLYPSGSLTVGAAPVPTVMADNSSVNVVFGEGLVDRLTFARDSGSHDGVGNEGDNLITLVRNGGVAIDVLAVGDVNMDRDQGKVGLTTLDAGYDFGPVPDWLVTQRLQNVVYTWPINTFFDSQYAE